MYDLHGTELNFIHKSRFTRGLVGLATGGPLAGATAFVGGGGGRKRLTGAQLSGVRDHVAHGHGAGAHSFLTPENLAAAGVPGSPSLFPGIPAPRFSAGKKCFPPFFSDGRGGCELDLIPGPGGGGTGGMRDSFSGAGEPTMGRYGVAMVPVEVPRSVADCTAGGTIRGMVLGDDGLCYNKRDIRNSDRMWPKGRAPLLTGGEQRAISIAATAAGKLARSKKRLKKVASTFAKAC